MTYYKTQQILLQNAAGFFITKRGKILLQNAAAFLLQNAASLLHNAAGITKRVVFITKRGIYYKTGHNTALQTSQYKETMVVLRLYTL